MSGVSESSSRVSVSREMDGLEEHWRQLRLTEDDNISIVLDEGVMDEVQ